MYLKRLELQGFKSFAQNTALDFQCGISTVVGPNGSGKSNIADALRFVLGEQSMKNVRSKKGEDLIFSGSARKPRMNMAHAALHFDNEDGSFGMGFQTVVIKRKIFRDGENQYYINDTQVRLRDLAELIAKTRIGLKGYAVINQGMGDSILNVSSKERREIMFEALGLKEFQMKKMEAISKLSQTKNNLEKARSVVREIEPHLKFLKKQAEKLNERSDLEQKLKGLESRFLQKRIVKVEEMLKNYSREAETKSARLASLRSEIEEIGKKVEGEEKKISLSFSNLPNLEQSLFQIESSRNALERKIGRAEGMISAAEKEAQLKFQPANIEYIKNKLQTLGEILDKILSETDLPAAFKKLGQFSAEFKKVAEEVRLNKVPLENMTFAESNGLAADMQEEREKLLAKLSEYDEKISAIKEEMRNVNLSYHKEKEKVFELKNKKREKELNSSTIEEKLYLLNKEIESFSMEKKVLDKEREILEQKGAFAAVTDIDLLFVLNEEETRREIEKLKVKLENVDLIDENIKAEYETTLKRHEFLVKESADLEKAIQSLYLVIAELDQTISARFKEAFKRINESFSYYFKILFDGGIANLEIVKETKNEDEFATEVSDRGEEYDYGIDINVSLPRKKISGLSALSGGERALTSLALLFALISTSPPPFLVLDEIDAPLDEANSARFSKILNELKNHTQFIIITHNRETMRNSDILYGVTMQEDGVSKLLSLKFDETKV